MKGFPTLFFHRNGDTLPYSGGRSKDALLGFAERMSGPPFLTVKSLEEAAQHTTTYAFALDGCDQDGPTELEYKKLAGQRQAEDR